MFWDLRYSVALVNPSVIHRNSPTDLCFLCSSVLLEQHIPGGRGALPVGVCMHTHCSHLRPRWVQGTILIVIIFLISLSNSSELVCGNSTDFYMHQFCILQLDWIPLLVLALFYWSLKGFFKYNMSSENGNSFISFFPIWMPLKNFFLA